MFIVIDDPNHNFSDICADLNTSGIPTKFLSEPQEIHRFIRKDLDGQNVFMIHGSVGQGESASDKGIVSDTVTEIIEKIHNHNPFARVLIYSNASSFPLRRYITELQIDGHLNGILSWEKLKRLAARGNVTPEELRSRGQTAEDMHSGLRVSGETSAKRYREKETLD